MSPDEARKTFGNIENKLDTILDRLTKIEKFIYDQPDEEKEVQIELPIPEVEVGNPKNKLLRQLLIDEEGIELEAYKDHLGFWTIGIGHRLDQEQSEEEIEVLTSGALNPFGTANDVTNWNGFKITEEQAYALFDIDVQDAIEDIAAVFTEKELDDLGEVRRAVVLSMVFQLGGAGFRKFKNFIAKVKEGKFVDAGNEMMDSLAARQTPARFKRASFAMQNNCFEKDYEKKPQTGTISSEILNHMEKSIG